ncbi:hypothetical protein [Oscillatoria acuminata]|uniref:Uncharacterized protein n=1 Tax=Oscillatoria acuminata PCC 6304 TaxID=56110 RepID=K9TMI1_9CYAN|nr:hypothetical protein [Oscillatoria acuminata]AFY83326.1 hypothetical protein Oscil6304_3768 [Oscillatoria acuminata PCC 6304]
MLLFDKDSQKAYIKFREFVKRVCKIEVKETDEGLYPVRDGSLTRSQGRPSLFPLVFKLLQLSPSNCNCPSEPLPWNPAQTPRSMPQ